MATPHFFDLDFPLEFYDKNTLQLHSELLDFLQFAKIFCEEFTCQKEQTVNSKISRKSPAAAELALNYLALSQAAKQPQVVVVNNIPAASRRQAATEEEENHKKENETQAWTAMVLGSLGLGLYSLWKVADTSGQVEYLSNLFELVKVVKVKISSLGYWIRDRKALQMVVPEAINKDRLQLQSICDNLEKLNNTQEKLMTRNSYGILTLSAGVIFASRFHYATTHLLHLGLAGMSVGACSWIYSKATYSSNFHKRSLQMIASRAKSDIEGMEKRNEAREHDLMRLQAPKSYPTANING